MTTLSEAILAAPAGVALLGRLEARHFLVSEWAPAGGSSVAVASLSAGDDLPEARVVPFEVPDGTSPASVEAAVRDVQAMSLDDLLALAVEAGYGSAGPWSGSSEVELVRAYRDAAPRAAIADAVAERFAQIDDAGQQEWWHSNHAAEGFFARRCFENLDDSVYDNGQFTHNGMWTTSTPAPATHQALASAWEIYPHPISRWRFPVRDGARVFEINEPSDWVGLAMAYPTVPAHPNTAWELPGLNDHNRPPALAGLSNGHAARNEIDHLVMPQWSRVAEDYDGVHLTWRGWLTTEGFVSDTPDGGVTMLRYWFSERTLWLNDVFGEPEPLPAPTFEYEQGADVTTDAARRQQDREVLRAMLGR